MISLQSISGGKRAIFLFLALLLAALLLLPESRQEPLLALGRHMAAALAVPLRAVEWANQGLDNLFSRYLALQSVRDENFMLRQEIARLKQDNVRLREASVATLRL